MTPALLAIYVLGLVLVVAVAGFVSAPLWGGATSLGEAPADERRQSLERQKRQALVAIKETELDHQMGKLSDEDLERMRARFERQALEAIDALERGETERRR